jgi:hypothetical protein
MTVTLGDVAREAATAALNQAFMCRPARVEAYDAATNTCTALILVPQLIEAPSGRRSQAFQPLSNVPVMQLRAGNVSFTVKPEPGDLVLLLFADRSIDFLMDTGQSGEPGDPRHHDLMDAVALPVFFTFKDVPADVGTASIGRESAPGAPGLRIHFTEDALCLGEAAPAYHVALAEKVLDNFNQLKAAFSAWVPVPQDGGASLKAMLAAHGMSSPPVEVPDGEEPPPQELPDPPLGWPTGVGSSTVKAKG